MSQSLLSLRLARFVVIFISAYNNNYWGLVASTGFIHFYVNLNSFMIFFRYDAHRELDEIQITCLKREGQGGWGTLRSIIAIQYLKSTHNVRIETRVLLRSQQVSNVLFSCFNSCSIANSNIVSFFLFFLYFYNFEF